MNLNKIRAGVALGCWAIAAVYAVKAYKEVKAQEREREEKPLLDNERALMQSYLDDIDRLGVAKKKLMTHEESQAVVRAKYTVKDKTYSLAELSEVNGKLNNLINRLKSL